MTVFLRQRIPIGRGTIWIISQNDPRSATLRPHKSCLISTALMLQFPKFQLATGENNPILFVSAVALALDSKIGHLACAEPSKIFQPAPTLGITRLAYADW